MLTKQEEKQQEQEEEQKDEQGGRGTGGIRGEERICGLHATAS